MLLIANSFSLASFEDSFSKSVNFGVNLKKTQKKGVWQFGKAEYCFNFF